MRHTLFYKFTRMAYICVGACASGPMFACGVRGSHVGLLLEGPSCGRGLEDFSLSCTLLPVPRVFQYLVIFTLFFLLILSLLVTWELGKVSRNVYRETTFLLRGKTRKIDSSPLGRICGFCEKFCGFLLKIMLL